MVITTNFFIYQSSHFAPIRPINIRSKAIVITAAPWNSSRILFHLFTHMFNTDGSSGIRFGCPQILSHIRKTNDIPAQRLQ